jgi:hypothetical protein
VDQDEFVSGHRKSHRRMQQLQTMKRLLLSVGGGILIPASILASILLLENINVRLLDRHQRMFSFYLYLILWPMFILGPIFPHYRSDNPDPYARRYELAFAISVILCDMLAYSLLTYAFLYWRARRKRFSSQ